MGALQKLCSFSNQALLIALSLAPRKLGCTHAVLAVRSEDEALKWEKKKNRSYNAAGLCWTCRCF